MMKDGNTPLLALRLRGFQYLRNPGLPPPGCRRGWKWGRVCRGEPARRREYGEAWHKGGTLANKQHVFDDFIAAAEYLISEHYTQAARARASTGAATAAPRSARCRCAAAGSLWRGAPAVGVLDMLRYHTASANARQWSSDYGLSEDPDQFKTLYALLTRARTSRRASATRRP